MTAFETAFALLMKSLPIDVDWDNKKLPPPIEVEWDCKKCGKSKSGSDKCECPPIKKGEAMEFAWQLLKIDEGMWEEIYAPLLAQTTGMGKLNHAKYTSDFVPTQLAIDNIIAGRPKRDSNWNYTEESKKRGGDGLNTDENWIAHLRRDKGDHGFDVDTLAQSILEEGFNPLKEGEGWNRSGREDPTFEFNRHGMSQFEGRHRLLALDKLGAPYVPYMGMQNRFVDQEMVDRGSALKHPFPLGEEYKQVSLKKDPYSLGDYIGRGQISVPPSYLYGREMVPGMGRLLPMNRLGEPIDMLTHIDDRNAFDPLDQYQQRNQREPINPFDEMSVSRNQKRVQDESIRNNAKWDWKKQPTWRVTHDDV